MRKWLVALGVVAALVPAVLVAQSTARRATEIYNFINGIRLNGSAVITGSSTAGNAAVVLPPNSVSLGAEINGYAEPVSFCGDLVNASTTYLGPGVATVNGTPTDYVIAGTACNALDSTTEATADNPISTLATKATGMRCKQSAASGASATTTYTLRVAAADAVTTDGGATTVSCAISGASATECRTVAGTTVDIAAGAAVAVKAVSDYDASTQDARCVILFSWP